MRGGCATWVMFSARVQFAGVLSPRAVPDPPLRVRLSVSTRPEGQDAWESTPSRPLGEDSVGSARREVALFHVTLRPGATQPGEVGGEGVKRATLYPPAHPGVLGVKAGPKSLPPPLRGVPPGLSATLTAVGSTALQLVPQVLPATTMPPLHTRPGAQGSTALLVASPASKGAL